MSASSRGDYLRVPIGDETADSTSDDADASSLRLERSRPRSSSIGDGLFDDVDDGRGAGDELPPQGEDESAAIDRCLLNVRRCWSDCAARIPPGVIETWERIRQDSRLGSAILFLVFAMMLFSKDEVVSAVAFSLLATFLTASCLRLLYLVRMRRLHAMRGAQGPHDLEMLQMHLGRLSRTHLRLAMQDRDFGANDYDMLLRLDEEHRSAFSGIPQSQIERLPVHQLTESQAENASRCSVCLDDREQGQEIRTLPCLHSFHKDCADRWLRTKAVCPICNMRVMLE